MSHVEIISHHPALLLTKPWAVCLILLCLFSKMEILIIPTLKDYDEDLRNL